MTKTQRLQAALKWALESGIKAVDYGEGLQFVDRGCGCCSGSEECPEEFRDVVVEVLRAEKGKESSHGD